jgi:hypothetical protein
MFSEHISETKHGNFSRISVRIMSCPLDRGSPSMRFVEMEFRGVRQWAGIAGVVVDWFRVAILLSSARCSR